MPLPFLGDLLGKWIPDLHGHDQAGAVCTSMDHMCGPQVRPAGSWGWQGQHAAIAAIAAYMICLHVALCNRGLLTSLACVSSSAMPGTEHSTGSGMWQAGALLQACTHITTTALPTLLQVCTTSGTYHLGWTLPVLPISYYTPGPFVVGGCMRFSSFLRPQKRGVRRRPESSACCCLHQEWRSCFPE